MTTAAKKCLLQMSQSDYDQLSQFSGPESFDDISNNDDIDGTNGEDGRSQNRGWGNKVKGVLHHLGRNEIGDCCVSQVTLLIQLKLKLKFSANLLRKQKREDHEG